MRFTARIQNSKGDHRADVSAGENSKSIVIPARPSGFGSSVSGGELLMLALATCYCNDTYREAARMNIEITGVDVECSAEFLAEGAPGTDLQYSVRIHAQATESRIQELAARVDSAAEIQNTVRNAIPVRLAKVEAITVRS